jgi:uncharacterized protein (TIGR02145 family)
VINVNSAAVETSLSAVLNDSPSIKHLLGQGKTSAPQAAVVKAATPTATVSGNSFTDSRDGQKYRVVKISSQVWMAENLNYDASGSNCYKDSLSNCKKYGRLYNWATAMKSCPKGWHLPSASDWDILMKYVQTDNGITYTSGSKASVAGKYLKATSGWAKDENGKDKYGFAALPGGNGYSVGSFSSAGSYGFWWSASERGSYGAYYRYMYYNDEGADWSYHDKGYLVSVRCLQD